MFTRFQFLSVALVGWVTKVFAFFSLKPRIPEVTLTSLADTFLSQETVEGCLKCVRDAVIQQAVATGAPVPTILYYQKKSEAFGVPFTRWYVYWLAPGDCSYHHTLQVGHVETFCASVGMNVEKCAKINLPAEDTNYMFSSEPSDEEKKVLLWNSLREVGFFQGLKAE